MKYIKYDDEGSQMSSEETPLPKIDAPKGPIEEINPVELVPTERIWRGVLVGLITGVPLAALAELIRFVMGKPWDDFLLGIFLIAIVMVLSGAVAYFYHRIQ